MVLPLAKSCSVTGILLSFNNHVVLLVLYCHLQKSCSIADCTACVSNHVGVIGIVTCLFSKLLTKLLLILSLVQVLFSSNQRICYYISAFSVSAQSCNSIFLPVTSPVYCQHIFCQSACLNTKTCSNGHCSC